MWFLNWEISVNALFGISFMKLPFGSGLATCSSRDSGGGEGVGTLFGGNGLQNESFPPGTTA